MASLPTYACVLLEGYQETPDFGVLRTDMDNSIAKQRPRRSLPIVTRTVKIKVDDKVRKAEFDEWFAEDLNGGTAFFEYTDPLDGVLKQARFVGGQIQWTSLGLVWFADASLETLG